MSNFFSNALATIGAALTHVAGNAPAGSIESIIVNDLEAGANEHAAYEAGEPVVVTTFTEHGVEGKVIALRSDSAAYAALFPPVGVATEVAATLVEPTA